LKKKRCVLGFHSLLVPPILTGNAISQALPLLKAAYDRGLNTWDTANVYCNGASEVIVGKALKKYNIPRHKVVILTKGFFAVGEDPGRSQLYSIPLTLTVQASRHTNPN
jgi:aryl-alcohol dehydrogenase-like predicted oxidoreductase